MGIEVHARKAYRRFKLEVSFESTEKRIGILGASGSGKSLTLKSIAGLVRPDEGRISFDGRILFSSDEKLNIKPGERDVGYLFQDYALFPNMTVKENIAAALHGAEKRAFFRTKEGGGRIGHSRDRAEELIERFGLGEIKDQRPDELSGGQKQKTALARMLARDPKLLLLDEPFSAMDSFLREGLRLELMRILDGYDKTVIMVSHDRDELYQMCSYLVLVDGGRVIAQGDRDELFKNPKSPVAARLTGCKNLSRIERINAHRVKALDWQEIELATEEEVAPCITHIGIRAHDLVPEALGVNVIKTGKASVSRLPFEWYVTLENGLWWKLPKKLYAGGENIVPETLCVPPERILLLSDK